MSNVEKVSVTLSGPTVFADLNAAEGKEADFAREHILVSRLKFKNFKHMQGLEESKQMQYAISSLTGLSENDIDELYAEDAAEISKVIYGFIQKYLLLAKQMMGDVTPSA